MRSLALIVAAIALFPACAEPPIKEMNQAQGAIDAARAAQAETYAPTEFAAAVGALRKSEEAVAQRDYRLALNHAIESREQATAAAKTAANERTRLRGEIERQLAAAVTLVAEGRGRMRDPAISRLPRRVVQQARDAIEAAGKALQEARSALNEDNYEVARKALAGVTERVQQANTALTEAAEAAPAPRKRR
jgi:hypothetical protein